MKGECTVVCISRTLAAGGEDIARQVANSLGFRYADELIVHRAAEAAGVKPDDVSHAEKTPGLVTRILESMGRTPLASESGAIFGAAVLAQSPDYESLLEDVIVQAAAAGRMVIVAHGASIPLGGTPGVLRVLITGSPGRRAERLAREQGIDTDKASRAIRDSDNQRKAFLKRFYNVSDEAPTHYDLVINTDAMTAGQAERLILDAAQG